MKRHELMRHLALHECRIEREGSRHTILVSMRTGVKTALPRHTEIENRLAVKICKQLDVPPIR